jgi:prevent-host-death family protein
MRQVNVDQAKTELDALIQAVLEGDEVILTQDGEPVVRLVATPRSRPRRPGTAKGQIIMAPDFDEPLEDFAEYMG